MSTPFQHSDPHAHPQDLEHQIKRNRQRADWLRDQLDSFAEHVRSTSLYNQDQLARALEGIAGGREWQAMVWR